MKKTLAVISMLVMCSATSAFAMDNNMMMDKDHMSMMVDKHMKMMDTNGDGMISKDEWMTGMGKKFDDNSSNGMMSKDAMMDMHMKEMKDMNMMMKKDGMMDSK